MFQDFIIAGDLNADCNYVSKSKWESIRLRTEERFQWLIKDGIDTTIYASECAYDRYLQNEKQDVVTSIIHKKFGHFHNPYVRLFWALIQYIHVILPV